MPRNLCDMSAFPQQDFFSQYRLPAYGPQPFPYLYTRVYLISAFGTNSGAAGSELADLTFEAMPFEDFGSPTPPPPPDSNSPGIPYSAQATWNHVLADALVRETAFIPPARNPLDIQLYGRSRVILLLRGHFWSFSREMEPISTKHEMRGRYFDVQKHVLTATGVGTPGSTDPYRCISFFSFDPCRPNQPPALNVKHGFSLNVEFVNAGAGVLPITIDPDIENKGGGTDG